MSKNESETSQASPASQGAEASTQGPEKSSADHFLPLHLIAKRGNWGHFLGRKKSASFQITAKKVLERDQNTCRFCGFSSDKYQEIINIDHQYENNDLSNLATSCNFCALYLFIDGISQGDRQTATLLFLPEITQTALNHFCRVLFCGMLKDAPYKGKLLSVYLSLQERKTAIENIFGPGSSNPSVFGQSLLDCGIDLKQQINHPLMKHVRLLPTRKYFKTQIEYWRSTVFSKLPL
ncbi:MAG: type IVB secretion system protein IcmJDotN [Gammaproteobacteria bacterium]